VRLAGTARKNSMTQTRRGLISSAHARCRATLAEEGCAMHMATQIKRWTLEEVDSLPDDGNKYELIRGELFVTPPPTDDHETIAARLTRILDPFIAANGLGMLYHPRAVMQFDGSQVEPDLMVRQPQASRKATWSEAPTPILIVEILSPYTRRRDHVEKRSLYIDAGVEEYWIVDPEENTVTSIRAGRPDVVSRERLVWAPTGAKTTLTLDITSIFA